MLHLQLTLHTFSSIAHSVPTMSDCAVGPDDTLLDAKDIEWYEDADSLEPIKQAATSQPLLL